MIDKPEVSTEIDRNVSVYRNVKFMRAGQERTGDRMVVMHINSGSDENVVILEEEGRLSVKVLERKMEISVMTLSSGPTRSYWAGDKDLDEDSEKRLLAIYKKFQR